MAGALAGSTPRRPAYLTGVLLAVALGGASRLLPIGHAIWDKSVGDAAYAMMIFCFVGFVQPRSRSIVLGSVALALCMVIECFQLTGIPSRLPRVLQIALGTRFAWHDIACYVVGASVATLIHALATRAPRGPEKRRDAEAPDSLRANRE